MRSLIFTIILLLSNCLIFSQNNKDKSIFKEYEPGFYENFIKKDINNVKQKQNSLKAERHFAADLSKLDVPNKIEDYKKVWHNDPVSQGATGTCWCFAATSFMESEIYRLSKKEVKLSEMFFTYWDYIERAKEFVADRGETYFEHGSEANAVKRMMKMYGAAPLEAFPGKLNGEYHNHGEMMQEMKDFLKSVKENSQWDEDFVVKTIKSIMEHYMGIPPKEFQFEGKTYTPQSFVNEYLKFKPEDSFSFMSEKAQAYNQLTELIEPDNWWHSKDYYNISLNDYMDVINKSLENEFSVCICGDVSEPGHDKYAEAAIIPSFDIPQEFIDEDSRQFRLSNKTTTDDHCIHFIGYIDYKDGHRWYLAKDSGAGAFDGEHKGYRFYRDDYVKLKTMNIMVFKYAAKNVLDKIIK